MSISQNFPEEGPTLNLNFAGSRTLDPRITFSRTTTGTYMDANGLIVTAPADAPRFDHRYVNGEIESLGLLVEEGRTNLTQNSETLTDYSNQRVSNSTVTTGGPFGTGYHEKTITVVGGQYNFHSSNQISLTTGQTITFSIFFKNISIDPNQIYLRCWTGSGRAWTTQRQVRYNLSTLTATDSTGTIVNKSIQAFPDGWYRLSMTVTADQNGFAAESFLTDNNSIGTKYQIMGAQVEAGAFPTSYIPTEGSTVTRTADNASITGSNFTEWYSQDEGALCATYSRNVDKNNQMVAQIRNADSSNRIEIRGQGSSSNSFRIEVIEGDRTQQQEFQITPSGNAISTFHKCNLAYKQNNFASAINGTLYTDDAGVVGNCDRIVIGAANYGATGDFNGHIAQLTYYPQRLPNSQLIALTR
jgi:hypothetical protein